MRPFHELFQEQKVFHDDPCRFKAALTTRRAGKSTLAATRLIDAAQSQPGVFCPYIALTRDSAKRILWPILNEMNQKFNLQADMHETLNMTLPNRSKIFLVGADQKNFIPRLRGAKYKRAAIDEAQSYSGHLNELIDDVLTSSTPRP
jgi:hypothetical protein